MKTSDFDYDLPPEFIAQTPVEPRDASRLMVLNRADGQVSHLKFHQIPEILRPPDVLVLNQTRVMPARLFGRKIPSGGKVEILLLRRLDTTNWETLVGGKGLVPGKWIQFEEGLRGQVIELGEGSRRSIRLRSL